MPLPNVHKNLLNLVDEYILPVEGGYVNDPNDSGGETMYGITKRTARYYGYYGDMKDLSKNLAREIYVKMFIIDRGYDKIANISEQVAGEMLEAEVNVRPRRPIIWLQRILNAANIQQKLYEDLEVDGHAGPKTCSALYDLLNYRGKGEGEKFIIACLNHLQGAYYLERCEVREMNEKFFYGWIMRRTT